MDFTEEPLQLPKETKIESNNSSNQDLGDLSKRNNSGIIQTNPTRRLTDPTLSTSSKDDVEPVRRQSDSFPNITASSTTVKHDLYSHFSNRLDLLNSHQLGSSNPIWRQVLSSSRMNTPTNSKEALDFDNCFQPVCETLAKTNHKHGNFSSLLLFLLTQLRFTRNMAFEHDFSLEAYNAIILVRVSAKYMVDNLNRLQLHEQFEST